MACKLKRENGYFYAITYINGKRKWLSLRTKDASEADRLFAVIEAEEARRRLRCFSDFCVEFLKGAPLHYPKTTIGLYDSVFKTFLRITGDLRIPFITSRDIEVFKAKRINEVGPVTVNIDLRMLKAAFSHAAKIGLITDDENAFKKTMLIRHSAKEAEFLTVDQFEHLQREIDDPEFRAFTKFCVYTMTRRGEWINLRWTDVDLGRRLIHIRAHDSFEPKSRKARAIPMNDWVYGYLSSKPQTYAYVFTDKLGRQLNPGTITHRFKKYVRKAGLNEGIRWHSLRHTGISWLINNGVPGPFVQRIAGHSSITVTEVYIHVEDSNLAKAVNSFPTLN